ncbi:MAG: ABC transporter permease [Gammaproteobacteria bacterium]|nr:ABC transporter permease [Gammaproteobacteria bacterium]
MLLRLQRHVNEYEPEPLTAIVPGVALQQLWGMLGVAEAALLGISILVVAAGLVGMLTTLLTGLAQRRREMAVLRAVGAGPGWIFSMLIVEALLLAAAASIVGLVTVHGAMPLARRALLDQFGLALAATPPGAFDLVVAAAVTLAGGAVATFPAWRIYRYSLADGLTVRT